VLDAGEQLRRSLAVIRGFSDYYRAGPYRGGRDRPNPDRADPDGADPDEAAPGRADRGTRGLTAAEFGRMADRVIAEADRMEAAADALQRAAQNDEEPGGR
jgi:hypothetical protein